MLLGLINELKVRNKISAADACILSYWAARAGAVGKVASMGLAPGSDQTGHYSRRFDRVSGIDTHSKDHYVLQVPQFLPCNGCRTVASLASLLPFEALGKELDEDGDFNQKLVQVCSRLPEAYQDHPVVQATKPQLAVPLAFYVDGIQYSKRNTTLGVFVVNLATSKRHLCLSLRAERLCRCGCSGWCSLWEIFDWLNWCFEALAKGVYPERRHDDEEFHQDEAHRCALAGKSLGFRGAVCYIKADLAEYGHTFGFPTGASKLNPCFLCKALRSDLVHLEDWDPPSTCHGQQQPGKTLKRLASGASSGG